MTFKEYINQKEPKKQPRFSVIITQDDLKAKWPVNQGCNVQIDMYGDHFTYHCIAGESGPLWTLDMLPSVFLSQVTFPLL